VEPLKGVKEKIVKLYEAGNTIYILTARPFGMSAHTEAMLKKRGIPFHRIIYDLPVNARVLVNDYAASNPYPAAVAINTQRNSANWVDML
jgi:hypothetical protein